LCGARLPILYGALQAAHEALCFEVSF
jgi:hypothetical protein